jgi:putative DNA primase/helicase
MTSDKAFKAHENGGTARDATDLDHHQFNVTFFKDMAATSKKTKLETLPELRDLILKTIGPTKMKMPWLKLATFGDKKSEVGCLRHDGNVLGFDGIELDYDALQMSFEEAIKVLRRMKVRTLIYTSPSYTPTTWKWRLLIPLSKTETRIEMRAKFAARVDGYFGNIFAEESFKLSHSYFYGKANDNPAPDHQAIIIDGDFLDLRDDLYRYEACCSKRITTSAPSNNEPLPNWLLELLNSPVSGGLSNDPNDSGINPVEIKAALSVLNGSNCGRDRWFEIGGALFKAERISFRTFGDGWGRAIWTEWSLSTDWTGWTSPKPNHRLIDQQWRSIIRGNGYGCSLGTLFHYANEADPNWRSRIERDEYPEPIEQQADVSVLVEPAPPKTEAKSEAKGANYSSALAVVRVADVKSKKINWLWPSRIARGKLTMIAGMPDVNKSTMTLDLAARTSVGGPLPAGEGTAPLGSTIILTAEDDVADTVRPRLEVAGANLERIYVIAATRENNSERTFDLTTDIDKLRKLITVISDVALIIIDPVSAYMGKPGKLDSYRISDVRGTLAPLARMAAETGVAVIGIDHLNKSGSTQALLRIIGSIAFSAAPRSIYLIVRDEEHDDIRLFLPANGNNTKIRTGLKFQVKEKISPPPVSDPYPTIEWQTEVVTMTADEALGQKHDGRKSKTVDNAKRLLAELLAEKPMLQTDVEAKAASAGIGPRSLKTAKQDMDIVSTKIGGKGKWKWWWSLPGRDAPV